MVGRNRRIVWLAPTLLAILLHAGCHLPGGIVLSRPGPAGKDVAPDATSAADKPAPPAPAEDRRGAAQTGAARETDWAVVHASYSPTSDTPPAEEAPRPTPVAGVPPRPLNVEPATVTPVTPHQRFVPTATGCLLNMAPGESPVERLTEMTQKLSTAEAERGALQAQVQQLTAALEQRDKVAQQLSKEIQESAAEVQRTRTLVQALRQEMEEVRGSLNLRDKQDLDTIKAINKLLERLAGDKPRPDDERKPVQPR